MFYGHYVTYSCAPKLLNFSWMIIEKNKFHFGGIFGEYCVFPSGTR